MPWPQTGTIQYHLQLGLPGNQRVGVCNNWDLEPQDLLNVLALVCYQPFPEVLIVLYITHWKAESRTLHLPDNEQKLIINFLTKWECSENCSGPQTNFNKDNYDHKGEAQKIIWIKESKLAFKTKKGNDIYYYNSLKVSVYLLTRPSV